MVLCKIFRGDKEEDLERQINAWLSDKKLGMHQVRPVQCPGSANHGVVVTLFYDLTAKLYPDA